jgi:cytochrome c biogenesis protein CcmG, thiol:disulfide interchange protein DsbE
VIRAAAAGLVLAVALLAGCTGGDGATGGDASQGAGSTLTACPEQPDQPAAGAQLLPPVRLECPGGGALDLGRAPGVPTVVNLWGSWCGPCRQELPLLEQFAAQAGDGVRVVGVISRDGLPQAQSFAADAGVAFPNAFDGEGELMTKLGLNALPFTYFLDADGGLQHVQTRPITSVDELRALVAEHLGVQT